MSSLDFLPKINGYTFFGQKVENMEKDDLLRVIKFLSDEMYKYKEEAEEFSRYKVEEMSRKVSRLKKES